MVIFLCRADSGFRRVGPKEYKPRLLKVNDEVNKLLQIVLCIMISLYLVLGVACAITV